MKSCMTIILALIILSNHWAFGQGGELGNGFTSYENFIERYQVMYPVGWNVLDMGVVVTFSEPERASFTESDFLSITAEAKASFNSLESLLTYLKQRLPNQIWKPIQHNGLLGFSNEENTAYLLKDSGLVLHLQWKAGSLQAQKILSSIQLLR